MFGRCHHKSADIATSNSRGSASENTVDAVPNNKKSIARKSATHTDHNARAKRHCSRSDVK